MASLAMSCVKHLLFFFSLIFAIIGIVILVFGALLQSVYHNYSSFVNENFEFLPKLIILIGSIIFIITFFGYCGIVKENVCMISIFASLLLTIFIMEVVAGVATYVFRTNIKDTAIEKMNSTLEFYDSDKSIARSWDILQTDLHCCGVNEVADWKGKIPLSCCQDIHTDEQCTANDAFKIGCADKLYNFIENNAMVIILVAALVGFVQLLGVAGSCCLAFSLRKRYECV